MTITIGELVRFIGALRSRSIGSHRCWAENHQEPSAAFEGVIANLLLIVSTSGV